MTLMSATHYLPSEELKYSNYPEIYEIQTKIDEFQERIEPVVIAISDYDMGTRDAIYVNIAEVERILSLSYDITDTLGAAENVCYDILLPLRSSQEALHELIFSFKYEKSPVVMDIQRTEMKRLNNVINKSGEVIE
jgi:hypothetical protein